MGGARPFRGGAIRAVRPRFELALSAGRHPVAALGVATRDWSESKDPRLQQLSGPTWGLGDRPASKGRKPLQGLGLAKIA